MLMKSDAQRLHLDAAKEGTNHLRAQAGDVRSLRNGLRGRFFDAVSQSPGDLHPAEISLAARVLRRRSGL